MFSADRNLNSEENDIRNRNPKTVREEEEEIDVTGETPPASVADQAR